MKHLLLLAFVFTSMTAVAFPVARYDAFKSAQRLYEISGTSHLHPYAQEQKQIYDFEGIVKLSNCSGSIVVFYGQPADSKAYMMTNGHCLGRPFLKPGEVVINKPVRKTVGIFDKDMNLTKATATTIVFGTMTGTDLAFLRLDVTYRDLMKKKIRPFLLSHVRPVNSTKIDIVSGYWDRGYRCQINGFVYMLKEADWTWTDSIRYSQPGCNTIGGTSGSPIVQTGTRKIVGINNTGNNDGEECTMDNPCEVDQNGNVTAKKGTSYGQQTYQTYTCVDRNFNIDLRVKGCQLAKYARRLRR